MSLARRIFANCGFAAVFCATSDTRGENLRCCSQRLSEEEEELESGPELLLVKLNCSVRPLEGFLGAEWRDECLADGPSSHARVGCPGPSSGAVGRAAQGGDNVYQVVGAEHRHRMEYFVTGRAHLASNSAMAGEQAEGTAKPQPACVGDEKRLPDLADRRRCGRRARLSSTGRRRLVPAPEVRGSTSPCSSATSSSPDR